MVARALNMLPTDLVARREAFDAGLRACGFSLAKVRFVPEAGDLLVIWNRYGASNEMANHFESRGARVLVVENGYLGKAWRAGKWFSMAVGHHAGAGTWVERGPSRWDSWGVELAPWREGGHDTVILGQRSIGEPGIASPRGWEDSTVRRLCCGRIRAHPGKLVGPVPLEQDLCDAARVVTWHSAAALQALMWGIPVWYDFPQWVGAGAARPLSDWGKEPDLRSDDRRLAMFRRLAWSVWSVEEVERGNAIASVIG